jgi:hypothetical protein
MAVYKSYFPRWIFGDSYCLPTSTFTFHNFIVAPSNKEVKQNV